MTYLNRSDLNWDLSFHDGKLIIIVDNEGNVLNAEEFFLARYEWLNVTVDINDNMKEWRPLINEKLAEEKRRARDRHAKVQAILKLGQAV